METPTPKFNTHRALVEKACGLIADRLRREITALDAERAQAMAVRRLARELGISRTRLVQIRTSNRLPARHWFPIERITNGQVKASDFEKARQGNNGGGGRCARRTRR